MTRLIRRFGLVPILLLSALLIGGSGWSLNVLINNIWLVPVSNPQFREFQRAAMSNTIDPTALIQASDWGLIALFLIGVGLIGFGIALPFVYLINRRLVITRQAAPASFGLLARQSLWVAFWLGFCVWLQMGRTFGIPVALLLAVVFILFEVLIHIRAQSDMTAAAAD